MSKVTNEHYVPCCYLCNFSFQRNNKSPQKSPIYVFDKKIDKQFTKAIHDISSEYGFYDIAELGENSRLLEDSFACFEGEYATLLQTNIDKITSAISKSISLKEKSVFAAHFAIQYVRSLAHRIYINYVVEQLKEIVPKTSHYYNRIISEDYTKDLHNKELLDLNTANTFANIFENKKWIVLLNKTAHCFCTSDNPICVINYGESLGLCSRSCVVTIPI